MIAFIVFGTRGIRSTVEQGSFYCPQCDCESSFKLKKVTQFFTLYFIPLIPLGSKGRYVECQSCKNTYVERILEMRTTIDITDQPEEPKRRVSTSANLNPPSTEKTLGDQLAKPKTKSLAEKLAEQENELVNDKKRIEAEVDFLPEKQKVIKKLLIMMILADGKVEDSEIHAFHKVYRKMTGTTVADIYKEIEEVRRENKPPYQYLKKVAAYLNEQGKEEIIRASMMIAAADGDVDPTEISMVENFGKALELKHAQVKAIIQSVK